MIAKRTPGGRQAVNASLLLFVLLLLESQTVPGLSPSDEPVTWDLTREYPDESAWNSSLRQVRDHAAQFAKLSTAQITSASQLADLLDESDFLRGRAGNMARFALLQSLLDKNDIAAKSRFDSATELESRVEASVAWLDSAASALGEKRLKAWCKSELRLSRHGWAVNTAIAAVGHNYAHGTEAAFAALDRSATMPSLVYDQLMASDLDWASSVNEQGKTVALTPDLFANFKTSHDIVVRRNAVKAYYSRLKSFELPLGQLLTRKYEIDRTLARARNFENSTDAFFALADGLPVGTYHTMIAVTQANRPTLERYTAFIAKLNHITEVNYSDLFVAAPPFDRQFTLAEAKKIAIDSLAPLGSSYQETLRRRVDSPWFDFADRPQKDSGNLGVYWQVGHAQHPYGIMAFAGNYGSARTVAAMAALTMFYADIPNDKLPQRREQDFPIYGNSIWFMASLIQLDYLIAHTSSSKERISLLLANLRRLWSVYIQGVVATDFEVRLEQAIASGHPPTGPDITSLYRSVLTDYYAAKTLKIDEATGAEWMTLGQIYGRHVLDEWAYAMATAVCMEQRIAAHDETVIDSVVSPMKKKDTYSSFDLLRDAGADPTASSTYQAVFQRMNADMDAIEVEFGR
jgi:oligoendopeptidase F